MPQALRPLRFSVNLALEVLGEILEVRLSGLEPQAAGIVQNYVRDAIIVRLPT